MMIRALVRSLGLAAAMLVSAMVRAGGPDILIADFEGKDYGQWKVAGTAFGPGPAQGTLPGQMPVTGYEGKGLVNSYFQGDGSTGRLTSPSFVVQRKYINFLIGGGMHPGKTCINLLIDGKVVHTATGSNDRPGGTEHLEPYTWDVGEMAGKTAAIEIVDEETGGWGHINIDQIVQSDRRQAEPVLPPALYDERYRPQFHFSAQKNWLNDPNGMVFYRGEYHLFFQHNPADVNWGNMTWGHAVSPDMLHWKQLDDAVRPDKLGTVFSGSAVVDWNNTAGFQTGEEKPMIAIFTSAGGTSPESQGRPFTQSLAYSNDRGRTFAKYEKNPVLGHIAAENRDPKVFWHEKSKQWMMALYLDGNAYALFASPNLKEWKKLCDVPLPGSGECPDFFELPVDGDANHTQWVFWGANNNYLLGTFDGKNFNKQSGPFPSHWGKNRYAAQTFNDIPAADGRRIQIAWMNGGSYPGMPFNQQMSFPVSLTLRTFPDGVRLCSWPVKEIEHVRTRQHAWHGTLRPGENPLQDVAGELLEINAAFEPQQAAAVGLRIRGVEIRYDMKEKKLSCMDAVAPVDLAAGRLELEILVDRASLEIFADHGRVNMAFCFLPPAKDKGLAAFAEGGAANVPALDVWELKSSWAN